MFPMIKIISSQMFVTMSMAFDLDDEVSSNIDSVVKYETESKVTINDCHEKLSNRKKKNFF